VGLACHVVLSPQVPLLRPVSLMPDDTLTNDDAARRSRSSRHRVPSRPLPARGKGKDEASAGS